MTPAARTGESPTSADLATAARTALASSHDVHLTVRGRQVSHGVGLVDDDGEPLLVTRQADLPHGPARILVNGGRPDLGHVVLHGTLLPVTTSDRGEALNLLREHATCLGLGQGPRIRLQRLVVTAVAVALPGPGRADALRSVPLDAYAAAHADPWALFGEAMMTHLNHDHAGTLAALAAGLSEHGSALGWVHGVDPTGLALRVIDVDGARDHHLAFPVQVTTPLGVPDQLRQLAPHAPHDSCG